MNKIYALLIAGTFSFAANAQDYTISPSNDVWADIQPGGYEVLNIDLIHDNSTADSIEIQWELLERVVPSPAAGWDYSYCDYDVCYLGNATGGTMKKVGPNENGFLKVTLLAGGEGWGFFKFRTFITGDEANADTLTFTFHSILGISDLELGNEVSVYPNPLTDNNLSVNNVLPESKLTIQNALGQVVATRNSNNSKVVFNNLDLRNGVYFVRLERNGSVYATRKLIVR